MEQRVIVEWTETAKRQLSRLPPKVRKGLLRKAEDLRTTDPRLAHKPLVGPLKEYYRITYSRYRAVYSVRDDKLADGNVLITIHVRFVAAGIRKERSKEDVYRIAQKAVELGIIDISVAKPDSEADED